MDRDDRDSSFKELHACAAAALNGLTQPSLDRDDLIVTAGIKLQSNQAKNNSGNQPASFVTMVLNGTDLPRNARTTVLSASSGGNIKTFQSQPVICQNDNALGHVSITSSADGHTNGRGILNVLQNIMPNKPSQQTKSKGASVTFALQKPIISFNIHVKDIGKNNKMYVFPVEETNTVDYLKELICQRNGMQPDEQHLVFAGKKLISGKTLGHYKIKQDSEVFLQLRCKAG